MRKSIMFDRLREDIAVVFERDPAARSAFEVLTCYPGLHALVWHRDVVNPLWRWRLRWLARWLAHWARCAGGLDGGRRAGADRHTRGPGSTRGEGVADRIFRLRDLGRHE